MNENNQQSIDVDKNSEVISVEARNTPETTVSGIINQIFNRSNILLNSLKDFSNKYNSDDRKILSNKKFLLTFNELISLIKEAIETQVKIFETDANQIETLKNLTQDFINDLSYNIFSYEKIEVKQHQKINNIKNPTIKNKTINNHNYNSTPLSPKALRNKAIEYNNSNRLPKNKPFVSINHTINIDKSRTGNLTERKNLSRKKEENYKCINKNIRVNKMNNSNKKNINNKSVESRKNRTILKEKSNLENSNYISFNSGINNVNISNNIGNINKHKYSHIGGIFNKIGNSIKKINANKRNQINKNNMNSKKDISLSDDNINDDGEIIKSSSVVKMREDIILTEGPNENKIIFSNIKKKQKVCYENNLFNSKTIIQKEISDHAAKTPNNLALKFGQNIIQDTNDDELKEEE